MIAIMSDWLSALFDHPRRRERTLAAGSCLFHAGDPVVSICRVISGEVHLVRVTEQGLPIVLQRAGPGDVLAEASVFSDRYHCDGFAATDSCISSVPAEVVLARLSAAPGLAVDWSRHLARELQAARMNAQIRSLKTVAERLDAWLSVTGGRLPPRGDRKGLAGELGVTPEALYRELSIRRRRIKA